jgi:hypothetical protein
MAAGLKGDHGRVHAIQFALGSADGDGRRLCVGQACAFVGGRSDDIARRIEQHATNGRIGGRRTCSRPPEIEGEARRGDETVNRINHMA